MRLLRRTSNLALGIHFLSLASAEDSNYVPINASAVLDVPRIVTAGEDTLVHLNFSNSAKASYEHQFMEIYAWAWTENEWSPEEPNLYCLLNPCVATNLTTISINIPPDALPDTRMLVSYSLFGSLKVGFSTWGDQSTGFNLTGGEATLSAWERKDGWGAVNHWSSRLPCTSVACARTCLEEHLDVDEYYWNQANSDRAAFADCVESCPGLLAMGEYSSRTCTLTNATETSETDESESATATSSTGAASSTDDSSGPRTMDSSLVTFAWAAIAATLYTFVEY
ncbi:hypothetical protein EDB81DRAFT_453389 [Dactylonectria macrodidyma]|uniref:Uncharacterized protein n=1 Tax=Dactylonectria macrodidyma TaxID=307937 RepID=A0A9P9J8E5_9HYPO|nr:hypothetical protein EDB81DRAFT_453389 [Dactylonectria macrodidyma]